MINYWWVTRPKRILSPVPSILNGIVTSVYHREWSGNRDIHLSFEEALESAGIKRVGDRRDQTGGGARTYMAWLKSLGLIFNRKGKLELTLAGEAILRGENPYPILTHQVLKYQFPSTYSISRGVKVNERFRIHPFIFLLRLLNDTRVRYLTQEEIAKIIIVEADSDSDSCYERIVKRIHQFRDSGDDCLEKNFFEKYAPGKGGRENDEFGYLLDIANTFINWLDYTRLIIRETGQMALDPDKKDIVVDILSQSWSLIKNPEDEEYFQRIYGLDPAHKKDTRNLDKTETITPKMIKESIVKEAVIDVSMRKPITSISSDIVNEISAQTGIPRPEVEDIIGRKFPRTDGLIRGFLASYRDMAFSSTQMATEFEVATTDIFHDIFGFKSRHVGPIGLTPDVLILSDGEGFSGIFDNKAYREYSISNDHRNRMVHNYINEFSSYSDTQLPLAFFSYIAGGFGRSIDSQIQSITEETNVPGSAIKVDYLISMIENQPTKQYTHSELKEIFSIGRQVKYSDLRI